MNAGEDRSGGRTMGRTQEESGVEVERWGEYRRQEQGENNRMNAGGDESGDRIMA